MRVIDASIGALWIAFWVYWVASAIGVKGGQPRSTGFVGARVALVLVVVALIRSGVLGRHAVTRDPATGLAGLVVVGIGLALAVWARLYLGRNWGMPMTQKIDPELVTSGPYRTVRHPIYTGMMLGMVGTAIAVGGWAFIPVVVFGAYFIYSARVEERFLADQFPDSYPTYRRSTKMLIPFVF
jgi:protein-S-isoprenylcysteine O-methyltransferase Ste14